MRGLEMTRGNEFRNFEGRWFRNEGGGVCKLWEGGLEFVNDKGEVFGYNDAN